MVYRNQFLTVAFLLLLFAVPIFLIIWPYWQAIFLAGALAIVAGPFCRWLAKMIGSPGWAAFLSILAVILVVLIPFFLIGLGAFSEARQLYVSIIGGGADFSGLNDWTANWQERVNRLVPGSDFNLDFENLAAGLLSWLVNNLSGIFSSVAGVLLLFFMSLFILFYLFKDGDKLKDFLIDISPLKKDYTVSLLARIKDSVNSVIRGSLIIAILQGVASGLGFLIFGLANPFLFAALAAIGSLIPAVGTALVFVPAVVYFLLAGKLMAAIGLAVWGFLLVGSLDNLVRPFLLERGSRLHPAAVFVSVLGGLVVFGPLGFVIGPVIFSIFFALLDLYAAFVRGELSSED